MAQSAATGSGPKFALIDQAARRITDADLRDKATVIHFGFTRCPVVCPTTLYEIAGRIRDLGPLAAKINFVFVTVDPDRDTPAALAEYMSSFDEGIIALSGDPSQIAALAQGLGAIYTRVTTADGDYTMEHSANAFLLRPGWRQPSQLYMGDGASEEKVLRALKELVLAPMPD